MFLQLEDFKSTHPDFNPPVRHNGEAMELFSLDMAGPYLVARYLNPVPVMGPKMERYLVDVYLGLDGREIYRVTSKVLDPPPLPLNFRERLGRALRTLFP